MNLPDAPIANEGFFATHFFTVTAPEKSKHFYVRILGGKVIKAENPCYIKLANTWIILNSGDGPTPDKPEVFLETPSDLNGEQLPQFACRRHLGLLQTMERQRRDLSYRAAGQSRLKNCVATCVIPTGTSSRSVNILKWRSTASRKALVE